MIAGNSSELREPARTSIYVGLICGDLLNSTMNMWFLKNALADTASIIDQQNYNTQEVLLTVILSDVIHLILAD